MKMQIQANSRLVYINSLASAHELHQYIQYLDEKYGVDSSDPNNTFGIIFLDTPIIQNGASNTIYFAGINSFHSDDLRLPKHQAHQAVPITVSDDDIKKLIELRYNFKKEIEANAPLEPIFNSSELENHGIKDRNGNSIPWNILGVNAKNKVYDNILKKKGFATDKEHGFNVSINVPSKNEGELFEFNVQFYRLSTNRTPHFSTTYDGSQRQELMSHDHPAYAFYKKWNIFDSHNMTIEEWTEMKSDLDELIQ